MDAMKAMAKAIRRCISFRASSEVSTPNLAQAKGLDMAKKAMSNPDVGARRPTPGIASSGRAAGRSRARAVGARRVREAASRGPPCGASAPPGSAQVQKKVKEVVVEQVKKDPKAALKMGQSIMKEAMKK